MDNIIKIENELSAKEALKIATEFKKRDDQTLKHTYSEIKKAAESGKTHFIFTYVINLKVMTALQEQGYDVILNANPLFVAGKKEFGKIYW